MSTVVWRTMLSISRLGVTLWVCQADRHRARCTFLHPRALSGAFALLRGRCGVYLWPMEAARAVRVSPRHHVMLQQDYLPMIDRAPREDFVVRTLARRMAGPSPLMTGDLVIAGASTRQAFPLAQRYPLHFRKVYYPGRLHGDTQKEFAYQTLASQLVPVPPPIGHTPRTFRSCLLPGTPLHQVCDLGTEPPHSNIQRAQSRSLPTLAGQWRLLQDAYAVLQTLQSSGLTHGDAHPHNFIVCPSPLEVLPVDFEQALQRDEAEPGPWSERCQRDRDHLLLFAIFLMCALGRQGGALATDALAALDRLLPAPGMFRRAIDECTYGDGFA